MDRLRAERESLRRALRVILLATLAVLCLLLFAVLVSTVRELATDTRPPIADH